MKKLKVLVVIAAALLLACEGAEQIFKTLDQSKLVPPMGLHSVTGNGQTTLFWYTSNYESKFAGYYVFMAEGDYTSQSSDSSLSSAFTKVDSIPMSPPVDQIVTRTIGGLTNGTTYSFAVTSFFRGGVKISYPSNIIKDTPRPAITTVVLKSASTAQVSGDDTQAGFDFDSFTVVSVPTNGYTNDNGADLVNEAFDPSSAGNIRSWLSGMNGGGLQDLGYMENLDGADVAPADGFSQEGKSIAVLAGHVYAIKTGDDNYGKIIITNIGGAPDYSVTFNAALQTQKGNRNYKPLPDIYYLLGLK
ncbi:hypothetical protein JW935_29075 [candidate division KSB1 bacterium]|nr:hypothetical protein [candidate division KSB1 bacterium]